MVSVCSVPARGGRLCEHFGGYKTINQIALPLPVGPEKAITNLIIIFGLGTYFEKYLKEKCCSQLNPQLFFKYLAS